MKRLLVLSLAFLSLNADAKKKKHYFLVWTYHVKEANIYGVSGGISDFIEVAENVNTIGARVSLIGEGILSFALPHSPIPGDDSTFDVLCKVPAVQKVHGINLSTSGTMSNCNVNGFCAGGVTQILNRINGISVVPAQNYVMVHNGVQIAGIFNEAYKMRGLQLGAVNRSKQTRGIQLGFWNVNERRKLPLINWNFSKAEV